MADKLDELICRVESDLCALVLLDLGDYAEDALVFED